MNKDWVIEEAINPKSGIHYWIVHTTQGEYKWNIFHSLSDAAEFVIKQGGNKR